MITILINKKGVTFTGSSLGFSLVVPSCASISEYDTYAKDAGLGPLLQEPASRRFRHRFQETATWDSLAATVFLARVHMKTEEINSRTVNTPSLLGCI